MQLYLQYHQVRFVYQNHRVKIKISASVAYPDKTNGDGGVAYLRGRLDSIYSGEPRVTDIYGG